MRINLIFHDNGAGLTTDARILTGILTAGTDAVVAWSHLPPPPLWKRLAARRGGESRYDLNVFLEHMDPRWWPLAQRNVLIPNQEWFYPRWTKHLPGLDEVLCKTQEGLQVFRSLAARAEFLGFTSDDHLMLPRPPREPGALHIAGRSLRKGTTALLRAWQRNPAWPQLTVVQRPPKAGYPLWHPPLHNVTYLTDRLSDAEIIQLQNRYWLHVRPSEAEGFGHPFAESLSCGAVVITTDAPPMNELVRPDRGILVTAHPTLPQGLVIRQEISGSALERAVDKALDMPQTEREAMGLRARAWWEANDAAFRQRLKDAVFGAQ